MTGVHFSLFAFRGWVRALLYRAESIAGSGPVRVESECSLEVGSCTLKVPGLELNLASETQQIDPVGLDGNGPSSGP